MFNVRHLDPDSDPDYDYDYDYDYDIPSPVAERGTRFDLPPSKNSPPVAKQ